MKEHMTHVEQYNRVPRQEFRFRVIKPPIDTVLAFHTFISKGPEF